MKKFIDNKFQEEKDRRNARRREIRRLKKLNPDVKIKKCRRKTSKSSSSSTLTTETIFKPDKAFADAAMNGDVNALNYYGNTTPYYFV